MPLAEETVEDQADQPDETLVAIIKAKRANPAKIRTHDHEVLPLNDVPVPTATQAPTCLSEL